MTQISCKKCGTELTIQQAGEPCPKCGSMDRNLTVQLQEVTRDKARAANELARQHYQVEPGLTKVIRCSSAIKAELTPAEPIKLLEVNKNTIAAGVMPLHFGPAPASGIPFGSIIVEVTPEEFEQIKARQLQLPNGWVLGDELPKPRKRTRNP
ncbi:MAG: hydrogenase maturation nickel metallochaperone HypA [Gemmataceae bacterium]|nr:hydrogenase maturation nickel metallochaperone HypA [Gemmataceae bacterium]